MTWDTVSICLTVLGAAGSVIGCAWKLVTNHMHESEDRIVAAINASADKIVIAIQQAIIAEKK